jgi:serine protease AprX
MRIHPTLLITAAVALATLGATRPEAPEKLSPRLREAMRAATPTEAIRAWVYFVDKDDEGGLARAESQLTARARARRERNRVATDRYDVAVRADYVSEIARSGVRVRHVSRWLNAVSVEGTAADLMDVASLDFVQRLDRVRGFRGPLLKDVEAPHAVAPPLREQAAFALNYGPSATQNALINIPALHDQGYSGSGVLIAMFDTGFNNLAHEALIDLDIVTAWDFVNGDGVVSDQPNQMGSGNHGTYTLSVIGGFEPGDLIGPAYGASYLLAKTENTDWERHVEEDDWVAAAEWVDSIGADIISSSLVYATGFTNGEPSYTWEDMDGNTTIIAIGADIAASRGILVVNAAGNSGFISLPANTLGSPADGDSVLAVGAVYDDGVRTGFSSVGPTTDGRIKPDVMAMGSGVVAASTLSTTAYTNVGGTSFSCPLTAGAAALILEASPFSSNMQIINALRQTASQSNAPDREYGWGIVDANAALNQILSGVGHTPRSTHVTLHPAQPNPFNPTTTIRYDIAARARVNLSIYDVRGSLVATLVDEMQPAGSQSVQWHARDRQGNALASGVYLCRLVASGEQHTRKLVLLK